MKKLFNYNEYHRLNEEFDLDKAIPKKIDINFLGMLFENMDVEKLLVNGTQIISILTSFFGKTGLKISLTLESLLLLYWIWKYETAPSADLKQDALIQLIFCSLGFVTLGAIPGFKAISSSFAKGYKEYKLTGNVAKIENAAEFKILQKNSSAIKKAATTLEETVEKNIDKLPKDLVKDTTKKEIKAASKEVKKYVDDVFEAEGKAVKNAKKAPKKVKKIKGKKSKLKTAGKLIKLGRKLFPIASYLLNRFLNKNKPDHVEEVENDFAILKYQIGNDKIVGANFPNDLNSSTEERLIENGKVTPTIIGIKVLIEDIDGKSVIDNYNVLTSLDEEYQYYLMCATNGEPIFNNFKLFALKGNQILISKRTDNNIEFVNARDIIKELKFLNLVSNEEVDVISKENFEKVLDAYQENADKIVDSYAMWSKIIERTFKREWWDKNYKLKSSDDKQI